MYESEYKKMNNSYYNFVNIDMIDELILENEYFIHILNEEETRKEIKSDIQVELKNKYTKLERENFLDDQYNKADRRMWNNYIGIYYDVNEQGLQKRLQKFTNWLEKYNTLLTDIPKEVKNMKMFQYDDRVWKKFLEAIKEAYVSKGFNSPPYEKAFKEFFNLNQHAYVARKAYLLRQVIVEFKYQVNSGKSAIPDNHVEKWKLYHKQEKYKIFKKYKKYVRQLNKKMAIEKIFKQLKKEFNYMHLTNLDAANEIKVITNMTFFTKNEGFVYESISRTIIGYKRYKNTIPDRDWKPAFFSQV